MPHIDHPRLVPPEPELEIEEPSGESSESESDSDGPGIDVNEDAKLTELDRIKTCRNQTTSLSRKLWCQSELITD